MPDSKLRKYARRGAEVRLAEIKEEARSILSAFPDLHRPDLDPDSSPIEGRSLNEIVPGDRRRRPRVSAAQRKAASTRMKRYWAERQAQQESAKKR